MPGVDWSSEEGFDLRTIVQLTQWKRVCFLVDTIVLLLLSAIARTFEQLAYKL